MFTRMLSCGHIYNIIKCKSVINVQCWLRKAFLASFDVIADEYLVFSFDEFVAIGFGIETWLLNRFLYDSS